MKSYRVTSNRNVTKETNKQNKERIYKNSKYIKMYVEKYLCESIKSILKV